MPVDVAAWRTVPDQDSWQTYVRRYLRGWGLTGVVMLDFVGRVKSNGLQLKGILEFLNEWEYFTDSNVPTGCCAPLANLHSSRCAL